MKRLVLIGTAVLVLALGIIGCAQTQTPTYTPKYTADRVIYIVQAQYPVAYKLGSQTVQTQPSITVTYIDRAVWKVQISAPQGYSLRSLGYESSKTLYFYETDGSLYTTYNPSNKTLGR